MTHIQQDGFGRESPQGPSVACSCGCDDFVTASLKSHGIIWRGVFSRSSGAAILISGKSFCSTGASLSLSRDGRFLALTDGCTLLLLDAAAAANAEAPTPHRGHLSSTVGLLRVSDCPTTPGEPSGSSQGGNPEGPPAYLGDSYQVSLLTHPAAEGPSGVSRRCVAGLRGGGCLCLGVTTRDGGVSLWLHREKEDPLPQVAKHSARWVCLQRLCLAADLGAEWRHQRTRDNALDSPPFVFHFLYRRNVDGSVAEVFKHRIQLSRCNWVGELEEPLVAAPAAPICFPCPSFLPQRQGQQTAGSNPCNSSERSSISNNNSNDSNSSNSSNTQTMVGLFSGSLVAVASQSFIAVFLVSGSHLQHAKCNQGCSSSSSSSSKDTSSRTSSSRSWRRPETAADIPYSSSSPSRACVSLGGRQPAVPAGAAAGGGAGGGGTAPGVPCGEDPSPVGPGGRPLRAATRRARAAVSAALAGELSSDEGALPRGACRPKSGGRKGRSAPPRGRGGPSAPRSAARNEEAEAGRGEEPQACETNGKVKLLQGSRTPRSTAAASRRGGRRAAGAAINRDEFAEYAEFGSLSSTSFAASDPQSCSSSSLSLANSSSNNSVSSNDGSDAGSLASEDDAAGGRRGKKVSKAKLKKSKLAVAGGAENWNAATPCASSLQQQQQQQQKWRLAADAAVEATEEERASAAAGLLQPLLLMVLVVPQSTITSSTSSSDINSSGCGWATPPTLLQDTVTDMAVSNPRVCSSSKAAASSGVPPEGSPHRGPLPASRGSQESVCCSFQLIAAAGSGAVWLFSCSFLVCLQQQQQLAESSGCRGHHHDTPDFLQPSARFCVEAITVAKPLLLFGPVGGPSGLLQLADVSDALLPLAGAEGKQAEAPATAHAEAVASRSLAENDQQDHHQQQEKQEMALLNCWRVAAFVCGSRLRAVVMRTCCCAAGAAAGATSDSVSAAVGCRHCLSGSPCCRWGDGDLEAEDTQPAIYRIEVPLFSASWSRVIQGPVVSLCLLPTVPLQLAAAAAQQVALLQRGDKPFLMLLAAVSKGALLPFVLYPDCNGQFLDSSNTSYCCRRMHLRWVLEPLAPVTSIHPTGRIEQLLMPRAAHSFRALAPEASDGGLAKVAAIAAKSAAAAAAALVTAAAAVEGAKECTHPVDEQQVVEGTAMAGLHQHCLIEEEEEEEQQKQPQKHNQQQQPYMLKENWREDGDPWGSLCPPSVKARRLNSLLSRRLLVLLPSPCGSLLFTLVQQNEVHLQLAVAPLAVSSAAVSLLSLEAQLLGLLQSARAAGGGFHGLPNSRNVHGGAAAAAVSTTEAAYLTDVTARAAAARCCAESHGLWALRLALRGPFQRFLSVPTAPKDAIKHRRRMLRGGASKDKDSRDTQEARKHGEDDEFSLVSDWDTDSAETAAAVSSRIPTNGGTGGDTLSAEPSHVVVTSASLLADMFRESKEKPLSFHSLQGPFNQGATTGEEPAATAATAATATPGGATERAAPEAIHMETGAAAVRRTLQSIWELALQGGAARDDALKGDNGGLWSALLETAEAMSLLRFLELSQQPARCATAAATEGRGSRCAEERPSSAVLPSSSAYCKGLASSLYQRRLIIAAAALRLRLIFAAIKGEKYRGEAALLLLQHMNALLACLLKRSRAPNCGAFLMAVSPTTRQQQLLPLLLLQESLHAKHLLRRDSNSSSTSSNSEALMLFAFEGTVSGSSSLSAFPPFQAITVEEDSMQELIRRFSGLDVPRGAAAAEAVNLGKAWLSFCPLCQCEGCSSSQPFRCYVCATYGHRFPACVQCLRCLYTESEGAKGAPLPNSRCTGDARADEGEEEIQTAAPSMQHSITFFYCFLCGAFVCGGEWPEPHASGGCGCGPRDAAISRGGRCCPACRGALRLALRHHEPSKVFPMMRPYLCAVQQQNQQSQDHRQSQEASASQTPTKQAGQRPKRSREISKPRRSGFSEHSETGLQEQQQEKLLVDREERQNQHLQQVDLQLKRLQQQQQKNLHSYSTPSNQRPHALDAVARMIATPTTTSSSNTSSSNNGSFSTLTSGGSSAVPEVHLDSVVLLSIAAHATRIQVWQRQRHQQDSIPLVPVVGLLLGPSKEDGGLDAISVTECAELPLSLLQQETSSSSPRCSCTCCISGRSVVQDSVLLRQALDKALVPLGIYFFTKSPVQQELPHAVTSLLTQAKWGSDFPLLVVFDYASHGASGLHKPPTQCFACLPSGSSDGSSGLRATATEAAPARLQQQIEAFECCACEPHPVLLREALGVCKRLCRPEAPTDTVPDDAAAATAAAVSSAAIDDEYFEALGMTGDAGENSGNRSTAAISASVRTVRSLQQLLQKLLPLSIWGPLLQEHQRAQQSQQNQQLQPVRPRPKFPCALKEQETETAAMAILAKATMGLAAAHATVIEHSDTAAALKAMQQLLSAETDI
ncbi:hypothetical protein, conserved [Eimeria maxima]|uniref:Uncharacterized protein n=1 Tax=Eimeria maxima TaxID=5804 RepID=U6M8S5_EIMMA|nr:hypothetical protein, conserved [Eimeria maxima]CDJ60587.1 hypothetical protein, conserved [Eimeria maxima]